MFRVTIRELALLVVIVLMGAAWLFDHQRLVDECEGFQHHARLWRRYAEGYFILYPDNTQFASDGTPYVIPLGSQVEGWRNACQHWQAPQIPFWHVLPEPTRRNAATKTQ